MTQGKAIISRPNNGVRVVIVDLHSVTRQALEHYLTNLGFNVIATASSMREALKSQVNLDPSIFVINAIKVNLSQKDEITRLHQTSPDSKALFLVGELDQRQLMATLLSGSSGCLSFVCDVDEIETALLTINNGNEYYSRDTHSKFDAKKMAALSRVANREASPNDLTIREREVLLLIGEGLTNPAIANELTISVKTVEAHKAHIMGKTGARSRTDLIRYAAAIGLISLTAEAPREELLDLTIE